MTAALDSIRPEAQTSDVAASKANPAEAVGAGDQGAASRPTGRTELRPETPTQRHARRKAWGAEWSTVARDLAARRHNTERQ